jgi:hypothetical protein
MSIVYKIKRFARADYEGLNEAQKAALREERNKLAQELAKKRNANNKALLESGKERLINRQSAEHQRFVNEGLLRDHRVSKDAMGQITTSNVFGRKKTHSNANIQDMMNKSNGFIWEKGDRRDAHSESIKNARSKAAEARNRILNGNNSVSTRPSKSTAYTSSASNSSKSGGFTKKSSIQNRRFKMGRAARIAGGVAAAGALGYGAYKALKDDE